MADRSIVVRLRAEIGNFRQSMQQAGRSATDAATATSTAGRTMSGAMTQAQAAAAVTRQELYDIGKAAQEAATGFGLSYNAAGRLEDQFGNVVTEAHAAELGLVTVTEATQEYAAQTVAATAEAAAAAAAATAESQSGLDALIEAAAENEEAWGTVGKALLAAGGAIAVGVGISIAKFSEFDEAMSAVDAATHETAGNMELLREEAIRVGAETAFSATEAAQGIEELAKAGVSTKDILNGGLVGAMDLAGAGALGVGEAAELAATALTQFKLAGEDIPHVADLLAAGAGKAQGSVQDLGSALKQSGLVAAQTGLSIEETAGGLAAFAAAGLVGSDAGTSFKSMLQRLTPQSKEAQKKMDELGISAYDAGGNFIGLERFAGNLQTSMKDLTDQQRNASMGIIFGSDAVRAASVIYEQGAEGVGGWIDAVNDAGYAAETTSRMQDNLAGDVEKLGGAFDTLLIKSGSGPSEILRGMTQAAEAAVDAVGKVPGPVLTSVAVAASLVGGLALLGGAFITIVPKIAATRAAMAGFSASSAGMLTTFKKIGVAGGVAAAAIIGIGIASAAMSKDSTYTTETIEGKLIQLAKTGGTTKNVFGEDFFKAASDSSDPFSEKVTSLGQALGDLTDVSNWEAFNEGSADFLNGIFGGKMTTQLKETKKAIDGMSDGLATMVQNGDADEAGRAFTKIAAEGKSAGVSVEDTAKAFTSYETALRKQANTLKVNLTDEEYYQWMLGNIPPLITAAQQSAEGQTAAAEAQAEANEETAKALAEVGLTADGTVQSLGKLLDAMFAAGLSTMSTREASRSYLDSLDALNAEIAKNGYTLDTATAAGRANEAALDATAQAGVRHVQAMAQEVDASGKMVYSQDQVSAALRSTYDDLVANYGQFGITGDAADKMARQALSIPDDVNIDTAIQNFADSMAKLNGIKSEAEALDGKTANVWVTTHNNSIYSEEHVSSGVGGSGGQQKATGGAVFGPGTGTSDDIPAWLSNGEHVWTAAEVAKVGGQDAMYRMRALAMAGELPAFAAGGAVQKFAVGGEPGHLGESANARANRLYREAQAAEKAAAKEQEKAAKELATARAKAAKEAATAAREEAKRLQAQANYRREQGNALHLDNQRGDGYQTVANSLSSAYSYSDRLRSVAASGNSLMPQSALLSVSRNAEKTLRSLYAQSEKLDTSLQGAKERLEGLTQVKESVSSSLSGEFSIGSAMDTAALHKTSGTKYILSSARASLNNIKSFGAKLKQLTAKGYSSAVVQEVAGLGSVEGIQAANALLAASGGEVATLNRTYVAIDKASDAAGSYVTDAMFKGGVNAAAGLVKGLESQQSAIEKQMLKIGLGMESALKKALGIRSPSRKAAAIGDNFAVSLADRLKAGAQPVSKAAAGLGDAMYVAPSKSMSGGYGAAVSKPGYTAGPGAGIDYDRLAGAVVSAASAHPLHMEVDGRTLIKAVRGADQGYVQRR